MTGATFEAPDTATELSEAAQSENREMVSEALPNWWNHEAGLHGKIGFRPTTPDHLPLIGAVPPPEWMAEAYLSQPHSQVPHRYPPQRYQTGLFVSNGHGARGLMSVFSVRKSSGGWWPVKWPSCPSISTTRYTLRALRFELGEAVKSHTNSLLSLR